ncbi:hypothetical protein B0H14DRAFT_2654753 [Mycena olivaceomarginata]|nr:hypothetical protein B0H14DRAFT_2654753 [Mycena olivaceomarginata]
MWDALFSNDTSGTIRLSSFLGQLPVLTHFAAFLSPSAGDDFLAVAQDILTACKAPRFFILNAVNWETKLDSLLSINDLASSNERKVSLLAMGRGVCGKDTGRRNSASLSLLDLC